MSLENAMNAAVNKLVEEREEIRRRGGEREDGKK
jgi:hypothetical protein